MVMTATRSPKATRTINQIERRNGRLIVSATASWFSRLDEFTKGQTTAAKQGFARRHGLGFGQNLRLR